MVPSPSWMWIASVVPLFQYPLTLLFTLAVDGMLGLVAGSSCPPIPTRTHTPFYFIFIFTNIFTQVKITCQTHPPSGCWT